MLESLVESRVLMLTGFGDKLLHMSGSVDIGNLVFGQYQHIEY